MGIDWRRSLVLLGLTPSFGGCDEPLQEVSPTDHAATRWSAIPSPDGDRLAFALEPRFIHRKEHGVLVEGYATTVVGPTLVVDDRGATRATLATGVTTAIDTSTRTWILQQATTSWEQAIAYDPPPRELFGTATLVDRATFAASSTVELSPPIDQPIAVGDALLDGPASGASDVERDIVVRHRLDDGSAIPLHAGRGFAAVSCTRGGEALVVAYQLAAAMPSIEVVTIRRTAATFAVDAWSLPGLRLDPLGAACDARTDHVAIGTRGVDLVPHALVLDLASHVVTIDIAGQAPPLALRSDGGALAAVRTDDRQIMFTEFAGVTRPIGLVAAKTPSFAVLAGDQALFSLADGRHLLDLATGAVGPDLTLPVGQGYTAAWTATPWAAGSGFVLMERAQHFGFTPDDLMRLVVITATGVRALPVPAITADPTMTRVYGDHFYLSAHADGDSHLYGYDLAAGALRTDVPFPLCDEAIVLAKAGCR